MKYRELLNNITEVAKKHPNINSTFIGDVYELNKRNDVDYCAFVITQGTHRVNSDEDYIDYTLNLFYVDRLTADESNRTQIHSSGIDFMNSLLKSVEKLGVVVVEHTENVFNERFNDVCAGVYATVVFRCEIDECGQTIEIITPDELKVLEVTDNGIYKGLFKEVDVNVQGGGKEPVLETLNVKDNGTYRPNTGVDGFDIVEVNIPKEIHNVTSKSITENGTYNSDGNEVWNEVSVNVPSREPVLFSLSVIDNGTYTPERGVDGYDRVEVNVPKEHHNVVSKSITANGVYNSDGDEVWDSVDVNVPERVPVLESLSVTDNGTYTPESGVDGYNSVSVNVPKEIHNVTSKSITANGTYNSTGDEVWNRVDVNVPSREPVLETLNITENGTYTPSSGVDGYNSVTVNVPQSGGGFDTTGITTIDNLFRETTLKEVNLLRFNFDSVKSQYNLFYNAKNLEDVTFPTQKFPKNCNNTVSMFEGCTALKDTNVSDWFNPNVEILSMNSMFQGCSQLTSNISFHGVKFKRDGCYLFSVFEGCSSYTGNPFQYYSRGYIYPKNTSSMFKGVGSETLDLVYFDFTNCESMKSMFEESKVRNVEFSGYYDESDPSTRVGYLINSENLTDVSRMFYNTPVIAMELTFTSNANITNVTEMFYNCTNLTKIRLDGLVGSKVTTVKNMLYNVNSNIELSIKNWDVSGLSAENNLGDMFGYDKDMYIGHQMYSGTVDMSGWGQLTTNNVFINFFECFYDLNGINLDGTTFADETFSMLFNSYDNTDAVYTALFNALPQSTNGSAVTIDKDTSVPSDILQIAKNKNWNVFYARYWA